MSDTEFTYNDIAKAIFSMNDPKYVMDERGSAVEFLLSASDDIYEEFAKRTSLPEKSGYNSFEDLMAGEKYLNIYMTVYEDKTVKAAISTSDSYTGAYCPVPLSSSEQKDFYTFTSRFCKRRGQSFENILAKLNVYGEDTVKESENKGKMPEGRDGDER